MSAILRKLPFSQTDDIAFVRGDNVRIKAYQIIAWVSLSLKGMEVLEAGTPSFPAIIDPGHNHNFSIQEGHVIEWAGLRPQTLPLIGHIREGARQVPLQGANVWIHPNEPGQRDRFASRIPHCLSLPRGIAVYPFGSGFPPLPLLGLRALATNDMILTIDGKRREVHLRTERSKWWPW
jgi:hypothetical protein